MIAPPLAYLCGVTLACGRLVAEVLFCRYEGTPHIVAARAQ